MLIRFGPGISLVRVYPTKPFVHVHKDIHSSIIIAMMSIKGKTRNHQHGHRWGIGLTVGRLWNGTRYRAIKINEVVNCLALLIRREIYIG